MAEIQSAFNAGSVRKSNLQSALEAAGNHDSSGVCAEESYSPWSA
jgi:hypothetical protein